MIKLFSRASLVAGTILPIRGAPSSGSGHRIPAMLEPTSAANVRADDVLRVIRGVIRRHRTTRAGRPLQVLEVAFDLPVAGGPASGQRRDLEVEVGAEYDEASDFLRLTVESPDDLPWRTRTAVERKLIELANADEPHFVFRNIRESAAHTVEAPATRSIHSQLEEMESLIQRMAAAAPGTYETWQHNLERAAVAIEGALAVQGFEQLRCAIVTDSRSQIDIVKEIIRSARRQVVIACPFVRYDATLQFRNDIETVLASGRSIFFILGIGDEVPLDSGVGAWLYDLKEQYPERLFFSRKSARCHAKFVIADGVDLLLTSYNFLDRLPGSIVEIGVRLAAATDAGTRGDGELTTRTRPAFPLALELLAVAKEIFPDYIDGQLIDTNPATIRVNALTRLSELVVPSWSGHDVVENAPYAETRAALWKRQWQIHFERLKQALARLGTTYLLVRDAEHRRLLYEALRGAQIRLLIVSDQLSTRVIDRLFLEALQQCLARGVYVVLLYRRPEAPAVAVLEKVRAAHPTCFVHARTDASQTGFESHAKLLLSDDWCVISSFNFLSFSSDYEGAERYRNRTELGVLMHGIEVQRVAELLRHSYPALDELLARTVLPATDLQAADEERRDKQPSRNPVELIDQFGEPSDSTTDTVKPESRVGQILSTWFANARDANAAFLELGELEAVAPPFLLQAIAACLHLHSGGADKRWWSRLLEYVWWQRRDAHGFVLLLGCAPSLTSSALPPVEIATLAASCSIGVASTDEFDERALHSTDENSAIAVAVLAIPAVLYGIEPPLQALELIVDQLHGGIQAWSKQVIEFRTNHLEGIAEENVIAIAAERRPQVLLDETRTTLEMELRRCVALGLDFKLGKLAWGHLVNRPLGLQRLLHATESNDVTPIREFLREHAQKRGEDLLDEAVRHIARSVNVREQAIIADRRRLCVDHLNKVIRHTNAWSAAVAAATSVKTQGLSVELAKLAEQMSKQLAAITTLAEALEIERKFPSPLLAELRTRLKPLLELSK